MSESRLREAARDMLRCLEEERRACGLLQRTEAAVLFLRAALAEDPAPVCICPSFDEPSCPACHPVPTYFCNKCGYVGQEHIHPWCNYNAALVKPAPSRECQTCGGYGWISAVGGDPDIPPEPCPACAIEAKADWMPAREGHTCAPSRECPACEGTKLAPCSPQHPTLRWCRRCDGAGTIYSGIQEEGSRLCWGCHGTGTDSKENP